MLIQRYLDREGRIQYGACGSDGAVVRIDGDIYGRYAVSTDPAEVIKVLAPIAPTQIICIGLNYCEHAKEAGSAIPDNPIVFSKGINTVQHPGDPIMIPTTAGSNEVDYECELAVVISRACKNVSPENAFEYVLGYTAANDVSARDWQFKRSGGQWTRSKMFDTFCPLGPVLATPASIPDPNNLRISTSINGHVFQDWTTADMIFDVKSIVSHLSQSTTLPPGTVILTGTPHGVGMGQKPPRWLRDGDIVTVEIEGVGQLKNPVCLESGEIHASNG